MRRGLFAMLVTTAGCASTPAPAPAPVATVTVDDPPLAPIKIVDAPPPTIAEPPPETNPLLEQLTADSENLRELGQSIAKHQPLEVKLEAADRLLAVVRTVDSEAWAAGKEPQLRDARAIGAYDAMAEIGGDKLADFLLDQAETTRFSLARRRAAATDAESALPGDVDRSKRRIKVAGALAKLAAKESLASADAEAASVTMRLRPGFRRCYERALEVESTLEVRFNLNLTVDVRGAVSSSKADATPAKDLARCIEGVGKSALFAPIAKNSTVIVVPIAFNPNRVRTL
jgi:hypothetical protein